jgi:hypothetical protein
MKRKHAAETEKKRTLVCERFRYLEVVFTVAVLTLTSDSEVRRE